MGKRDHGENLQPAISREQTLALALSAWDLERTRTDRNESPRSRVIVLRTHGRLLDALEARQQVPLANRAFLKIQDEAKSACLVIHGTQDSPAAVRPLAEHLHASGLTVYVPRLPGHGLDERAEVLWRACLQDLRLRYRTLRKIYRKVFVVGSGFGAALAIHLAAREQVAALALLAPAVIPRVSPVERLLFRIGIHRIGWLRPRMGWNPEVLAAMKGARTRIPRLRAPIYAAQCDDDERISPVSLRVLQKHARHRASRFKVFPTGGHDILAVHGPEVLHTEVQKFFRNLS